MPMMSPFLKRLAWFLAPWLVAGLAVFGYLHRIGEVGADLSAYRSGDNTSSLVGFSFSEQSYPNLKYRTIVEREAVETMALGSSRVLQIRKEMFESSFFNAGFAVSTLTDYRTFWSTIPDERKPDLVLVGVDHWMFNVHWDDLSRVETEAKWTEQPRGDWFRVAREFSRDLVRGDVDLGRSPRSAGMTPVGYNAWSAATGFRVDGSLLYGKQIDGLLARHDAVSDPGFTETLGRIAAGAKRFEHGDRVNPAAIDEMVALLDTLHRDGATVVVFLPPFAPAVREALSESGRHAYIDELPGVLGATVEEAGAEFFDFTTAPPGSKGGFIDGFHGSEVVYAELLRAMADESSAVAAAIDPVALGREPANPFEIGFAS